MRNCGSGGSTVYEILDREEVQYRKFKKEETVYGGSVVLKT